MSSGHDLEGEDPLTAGTSKVTKGITILPSPGHLWIFSVISVMSVIVQY